MTIIPDDQMPEGLPDPDLCAELSYAQWCMVLAHLSSGAYRDVKPIIDRLMAQLSPQADAQQIQAILAVVPAASDSRN